MVFESDNGSQVARATAYQPITDGAWHQFGVILTDRKISVVIDGFAETTGFDFDITPTETPTIENIVGTDPANHFSDVIVDDVAIYEEAIGIDEFYAHVEDSDIPPGSSGT